MPVLKTYHPVEISKDLLEFLQSIDSTVQTMILFEDIVKLVSKYILDNRLELFYHRYGYDWAVTRNNKLLNLVKEPAINKESLLMVLLSKCRRWQRHPSGDTKRAQYVHLVEPEFAEHRLWQWRCTFELLEAENYQHMPALNQLQSIAKEFTYQLRIASIENIV